MIKVIVADDEINVVNLICNLVDWSLFDMEIVDVAHNGVEALALIEKHAPDLIITDIRMPGYDGLEMIERAKQINGSLEFVIISGYRYFEYAQSAIKFGVYDYLLKPIKKDELCVTLQKIRDRHRQKVERLSQEAQMEMRRQNDIEKLRSELFAEIISHKGALERVTLKTANSENHFQFSPGLFQFFIVKLDYPYERYTNDNILVLCGKVVQRLYYLLQPDCYDVQLHAAGSRIYGIVNYDAAKRAMIRKQLKIAVDEIVVFENVIMTIGLGKPADAIEQFPRSFMTAEAAVMERLTGCAGKLIEDMEGNMFSTPMPELNRRIETAIRMMDRDALSSTIKDFYNKFFAEPLVSGYTLFTASQNIARTCLALLGNHGVMQDSLNWQYEKFFRYADLCASGEELLQFLLTCIIRALDEVRDVLTQSEKRPVRQAKQYIQEHFMSPITLEEVAAHIGFTSAYFSTLFKKESGHNFLEYLSEVRINKACDLLKETTMTVAAICVAVGYSDIKHFTQNFKKHTGLRPAEYRKIFS